MRRNYLGAMKTILAAIDFSNMSELVVAEASKLAHAFEAKVVLVTVLIEPVFLAAYATPQKSIARITVAHERAVRARLKEIQARLDSDLVPTESVLRRGNPGLHIIEEAEERDALYIVVGSHGHTALYDLVLGSTANVVLKRARQPVVVVASKMRRARRAKGSRSKGK